MEFLLINHPLDCPICDQGGECELQDLAVGFGRDVSRFVERKRVVKDKNLGPLVSTDMTRCIHCTRCVRFGQDIAGIQELGATGRGEHMEIGTYIEHSVDHELSGNIIDLCPVGALNSKPFRYRGRGWEMTQYPLISPHDGVGTQLYGHVLRGRLMRVVPRPCEEINETWIADRDRFSYEGIYSDDRLLAPQVRQSDGSWREVEWDVALRAAAAGLQAAPGASWACWRMPRARSRSCTWPRAWPRAWAAPTSIIACASAIFATRQPMRTRRRWGCRSRTSISSMRCWSSGLNLRHEVPILAHRVRKAAMRGAQRQLPQSRRGSSTCSRSRITAWPRRPSRWPSSRRRCVRRWRRAPMPTEVAAVAAANGAGSAYAAGAAVTEQQRALARVAQARRAPCDLARRAGDSQ